MSYYVKLAYDYFFSGETSSSSSSFVQPGLDFSLIGAVLKTKASFWLNRLNKRNELRVIEAVYYPKLFNGGSYDMTTQIHNAISENIEKIELTQPQNGKDEGHLHVSYVYTSPQGTTPEHTLCIKVPPGSVQIPLNNILDPIVSSVESSLGEEEDEEEGGEESQPDMPDTTKVITQLSLICSSGNFTPKWASGLNVIHQRYLGPLRDYHLGDNDGIIKFDMKCCIQDLLSKGEFKDYDALMTVLLDFLLKPNSLYYKLEFLSGDVEKVPINKITSRLLELIPQKNESDEEDEIETNPTQPIISLGKEEEKESSFTVPKQPTPQL